MPSMLEDRKVLKFNPTTLQDVRAEFALHQPGRMEEAVDLLEDWLKKQEHFIKKDLCREYLERVMISSKGSVEKAKNRIDRICTLRTTVPYLFDKCDASKDFALGYQAGMFMNMPVMTADHHRVYVMRFTSKDITPAMMLDIFQYSVIVSEYVKRHDYSAGLEVIIDVREINIMSLVTNVDLVDLRNIMTVYTDGYGFRLKNIHILTSSKMVDALVGLLKQVVSTKISERILVHRTLQSLHSRVPPHLLPAELEGEQRSLADIHDSWVAELSSKEHVEYFNAMRLARTDESRRAPAAFNQHCLGMPGSFRTLTVD